MGDDICFDFCATNVCSASQYAIYGRLTTIDDSLSLNPNRCHHPLITQLSGTFVSFMARLVQNKVHCAVFMLRCQMTHIRFSKVCSLLF